MKEFRKRFVQLNMLLIGLVLLGMLGAVAVYMYRDYRQELRTTMEQVVEPLESVSAQAERKPHAEGDPPGGDEPKQAEPKAVPDREAEPDRESRKSIITVFYTPESSEFSVLSQAELLDEETLAAVLDQVVEQEEDFGVLREYDLFYYRAGSGSPYKIALASTGYIGHSMTGLCLTLALVWLAAMLGFLLVSIHLSKRAVRPMEKALLREKQFVADASHDLKTPLAVILANCGILLENPAATVESQRRWVDSTQDAAKNMQELIGDMLTLADAERRDVPLKQEELDASAAVTKAVLQLESVAYEKGVELEVEVAEHLLLRTDADCFQRIASSLVENAVKYEPTGGRVTVVLTAEKRWARLEVRNRSSQIPEEDLPHVFERFYRGDKSRQGAAGGHGLGLAITRELVERLGGTIKADSPHQGGTIFSVTLPMRR